MPNILSQDHEAHRKKVRSFVDEHMMPYVDEWEKKAEFPSNVWEKMRDEGLMGLPIPKEFGGHEKDYLHYIITVEELSRGCAGLGVVYEVHSSLAVETLAHFGTEVQKAKYLGPLTTGEAVGGFCLTEPQAGSDAAALETIAVPEGDHYRINGHKYFIINTPLAKYYVLMAMTDPSKGTRGISAFLVEREYPGFRIGKLFEKMGIHTAPTSEVFLEDCMVPRENLIGSEGEGFKIAMAALDRGRIGIAAQATGIAQAALEVSVDYAKKREQFGGPIGKLQGIQWMLADMKTRTEASRLLTYQAAVAVDMKPRFSQEAAMAKLFAAESAVAVTRQAIQIHGGHGYMKDAPLERFYRDAKITEIYEGTSEIQKMVIANSLLR